MYPQLAVSPDDLDDTSQQLIKVTGIHLPTSTEIAARRHVSEVTEEATEADAVADSISFLMPLGDGQTGDGQTGDGQTSEGDDASAKRHAAYKRKGADLESMLQQNEELQPKQPAKARKTLDADGGAPMPEWAGAEEQAEAVEPAGEPRGKKRGKGGNAKAKQPAAKAKQPVARAAKAKQSATMQPAPKAAKVKQPAAKAKQPKAKQPKAKVCCTHCLVCCTHYCTHCLVCLQVLYTGRVIHPDPKAETIRLRKIASDNDGTDAFYRTPAKINDVVDLVDEVTVSSGTVYMLICKDRCSGWIKKEYLADLTQPVEAVPGSDDEGEPYPRASAVSLAVLAPHNALPSAPPTLAMRANTLLSICLQRAWTLTRACSTMMPLKARSTMRPTARTCSWSRQSSARKKKVRCWSSRSSGKGTRKRVGSRAETSLLLTYSRHIKRARRGSSDGIIAV